MEKKCNRDENIEGKKIGDTEKLMIHLEVCQILSTFVMLIQ